MPDAPRASALVGGIFVGGSSRRMGNVPKGLLRAPEGCTIVERWRGLFRAIGAEPVLVGRHPAYAELGLPVLDDVAPGSGPLGGLLALLGLAAARQGGLAVAVACDMPYVTEALLRSLSTHPSRAPIVAPRTAGKWEPFFARYEPGAVLEVATRRARQGDTSLQGLLNSVPSEPWALTTSELPELRDWDRPTDVDSPG